MIEKVITVLGPIDAKDLGLSLMHEHIIMDMFSPIRNPAYIASVLQDVDIAIEEVNAFRNAGGRTIVEVTNSSFGQNALALKEIAEKSHVNIVAATGYYTEMFYTREVYDKNIDELANTMIKDIVQGIGDTGVRAGIIGEIGTIGSSISDAERKVFRAAARAQLATGVALTTHTRFGNLAQEQLDILQDEGVELCRVIIGHQDEKWDQHDYLEAIVQRGAYIEFDGVGEEYYNPIMRRKLPTNFNRIEAISWLVSHGYASQILLSSDICKPTHLHKYGGWGYDYLLKVFVPMLEQAGLGQDVISMILLENPKRVLPIAGR